MGHRSSRRRIVVSNCSGENTLLAAFKYPASYVAFMIFMGLLPFGFTYQPGHDYHRLDHQSLWPQPGQKGAQSWGQ